MSPCDGKALLAGLLVAMAMLAALLHASIARNSANSKLHVACPHPTPSFLYLYLDYP